MEKIDRTKIDKETWTVVGTSYEVAKEAFWWAMELANKQDEIIDHLNDKNCSPITCPFNTLIDQLAKRTKKLEFYDKQHRKEHQKIMTMLTKLNEPTR